MEVQLAIPKRAQGPCLQKRSLLNQTPIAEKASPASVPCSGQQIEPRPYCTVVLVLHIKGGRGERGRGYEEKEREVMRRKAERLKRKRVRALVNV